MPQRGRAAQSGEDLHGPQPALRVLSIGANRHHHIRLARRLDPYLALALGLKARGHRVTIATTPYYQPKVESEGIGFHAVRPNLSPDNTELIKLAMDAKKGSEYEIRQVMLPHLCD